MHKKLISTDAAIIYALGFFFLFINCFHIAILPIFGDEAIYLNWAQTIRENTSQLFIPLSDGKQPLFMWLTALVLPLFHNPLVAARSVSILAGFLGMIGIYLVGYQAVSKRVGVAAAIIYTLVPIQLVYNRLAVPDNLLAVLGIWALFLGLRLGKRPHFITAFALGMVIGLSILTKSPGAFFLLLLPTLFLDRLPEIIARRRLDRRYIAVFGITVVTAIAMALIMRLSPLYSVIGQRTGDFIFSPSHVLTAPLDPFVPRIPEVTGWLWTYLTWPAVLFAIAGVIVSLVKRKMVLLSIFLWFLIPLLVEMELARGFTPRYFLFTLPPLLVVAGYGLTKIINMIYPRYKLLVSFFVLLAIPALWFDYLLLTNPQAAPIPAKERDGYIEGWSSGYGIAEIAQYIRSLPQDQQILVGTEGHFGSLPDGLIVYLRKTPNIRVEGMGEPADITKVPQALIDWKKQGPQYRAFLVGNQSRVRIDNEAIGRDLVLMTSYPKPTGPTGQEVMMFYEIIGDKK